MNIIEMLCVWAERTNSIAADGAARLGFKGEAVGFNTESSGSWSTPIEEWEDEINDKIKSSLDALIYGVDRDKGILTPSEVYAVEINHLEDVPHELVSNRGVSVDDDYTRALFKLKPAMEKRGFVVEKA